MRVYSPSTQHYRLLAGIHGAYIHGGIFHVFMLPIGARVTISRLDELTWVAGYISRYSRNVHLPVPIDIDVRQLPTH